MYRREFVKTATAWVGALSFGVGTPAAEISDNDIHQVEASGVDSKGIYLNQVGLLPDRPKIATISVRANSFVVRSLKTNSVVFRSTLSVPRLDNSSGDTVQLADFSRLKTTGTYRVELDTGIIGDPFPIRQDVYDGALRLTMRSFYGQRCGCDVDLGGGYAHPKCHMDVAFHPSSGKTGPFTNYGGWHDAGDYGRYIINSGITTGTLLWAWELYSLSLRRLALQIPESGGNIPDFLAEVQWNLRWMLSMQDTDGGVWQKETPSDFCSYIMPQDEHAINYVIGTGSVPYKGTCATADFAAVMAIAARCYSPYAPEFSQRCLKAARSAWTWCQSNPKILFKNPPDIHTAEYGDSDCSDELLWATAELWRTTGDALFHQAFLSMLPKPLTAIKINVPSINRVGSLGYWSYALSHRGGSDVAINAIKQATLKTADELAHRSAESGYGNSLLLEEYVGTSNATAINQSMLLLIANLFERKSSYVNSALGNLHYLLGRNCFGISWVTQLGLRPIQHPHHRPSSADNIVAPWPGLLSGGSNAHGGDPITKALSPRPPMRMYIDDDHAYSCNEAAINCNAPLVFVLAALHAQQSYE